MKRILLLCLIISITSCNDEKKYSDEEVCSLLKNMVTKDQKLRTLPEFTIYNSDFQKLLDSIKLQKNLTDKQFDSLSKKEQNDLRKKAKMLLDNRSSTNWDSIADLQNQIDEKNTEVLIDIISYKGWPNKDSLNCVEFGPPVLIFRHSPKKYFDTIRVIIEKEYKENRMGDGDYMFIDNHLRGRPIFNFETVEE